MSRTADCQPLPWWGSPTPASARAVSASRVRSGTRASSFHGATSRSTSPPLTSARSAQPSTPPVALGVLAATGLIPTRQIDDTVILGELSLDGAVRPVRGVLPIAAQARRDGVSCVILPHANAREASIVAGLDVVRVTSLGETVAVLTGRLARPAPDLADVRGQALTRRALEITAAGGHNLLLIGSPSVQAKACWPDDYRAFSHLSPLKRGSR